MKKLSLLLMLCSFFAATNVFGQQWNGSGSISGNLYRNGNVGLQVSSPYARLDIKSVEGSTGGPVVLYPHLRLRTEYSTVEGASNWDITGTGSLRFGYGTTTANMSTVLAVSSSLLDYRGNNIRIGTGENQYNLGVATSPTSNAGHYLAFGARNIGGASAWSFTGNSTNNGGAIIHGDDNGNLFFITRGKAASNMMTPTQTADNVRLFVGGSGDVGIGTTTPIGKLHVADGDLVLSNGDFFIGAGNATVSQGDLTVINGKIVLVDGLNNELVLYNDGRIHAREIEVNLDVIPDYVFADDYELMPLTELQKFIDLNHHLPNIKSAEEYEAYGRIPLKELSLKLLEKVEELTLYTLEQEAEIDDLKAANAEIDILKKQMAEMQVLLGKMNNELKK